MLQRNKYVHLLFALIGVIFILCIWQFIYVNQAQGTYLVPSPLTTIKKLFQFLSFRGIYRDLGETILRMLTGFLLATVVGVLIGLFLGSVRVFRLMFEGIIDFFRSIPVTALYPVFVLSFGIGSQSKIAMIFWSCFLVITINTTYGVMQSNSIRQKMARLFGANTYQVFTRVMFFDALPQTIVGLRIAISYALIVSVLTEMFMGSEYGVGQKITEAYNRYQIDEMFALIFITGIVGFILNRLFIFLERTFAGWTQNAN